MVTYFRKYFHTKLLQQKYACRDEKKPSERKTRQILNHHARKLY